MQITIEKFSFLIFFEAATKKRQTPSHLPFLLFDRNVSFEIEFIFPVFQIE